MGQMNELAAACCIEDAEVGSPPVCPRSGTRGRSVSWVTVAALTSGPLPPKSAYLVCEASLGEDDTDYLDAFVAACTAASPGWFPA